MNIEDTRHRDWRATRRDFLTASGAALSVGTLMGLECERAWAEGTLRIGLVADPHYADREALGTRHYRDSLDKLAECVERMNEQQVDLLVDLGDLKDQDEPPVEERTLDYVRRIEKECVRFRGPTYHVLGNHDLDSLSKAQFLESVKNTGIAQKRSYYSFDVKGLHGVVLDACYSKDGADYDHGRFDWKDANIPDAQLDWLKKDLAAASGRVIVFVHQRLDGEGSMFVTGADRVRAVLERSGKVLTVFQGHHHPGDHSVINGIHYYTLRAMVEGPGLENNAYAIAEVSASGDIAVTGYGKASW